MHIGKDIVQVPETKYIIDFFGVIVEEAKKKWPGLYQRILLRVQPERRENKRAAYRDKWWVFAEPRPAMRRALVSLKRFIVTPYTAKFRPFQFVDGSTIADAMAYVIATDDAYYLGVLSSKAHRGFALAAGGTLEDRPRYNSKMTFFPFPELTPASAETIRNLGEQLDSHRKRQQELHTGLTVTGMYNVLDTLRGGGRLSDNEKVIHEQGLVSVLKQLHDDLDGAVFDAYGWPRDLTDEQILERLLKLNGERADDERRGLVRWLRPDFQNPGGATTSEEQVAFPMAAEAVAAPHGAEAWPKKLPDQVAAVRRLMSSGGSWTVAEVASAFKGAKATDVVEVLESLAALGLAVSYESGDQRRWRTAGRRAA